MKMDPEPLASRQPITRELERFLSKPAESSFCTVRDLELKLLDFRNYYNKFRVHRSRIRRQFRLRNPNESISNVTRGTNTVAVYTKRQEPREDEFAINRLSTV